VQSLVVNGVAAGVGAVLTFLPQILILFLFLAILEDCGYMARAAFLMDRWMGLFGLNGKSFIPLLSSFACAVPGILSTRTIEDRRDRFVTILIAPLMSCSARLPVYVLLIGAFIPATPLLGGLIGMQAATLLAMYLVGAAVAIPVALILKRTVLKGPSQSFLMELPTYKWPSPRIVFFRMYEQGKAFCVSAGTLIFAVAIVIWALGYYPHPAAIAGAHQLERDAAAHAGHSDKALDARLAEINRDEAGEYLRQSFLGRMGQWIEPAVKPLGWDWRIGTAAIASFPAREVVVATMGTIYNLGGGQDETSAGLRATLHAATWPDGRPVYNVAVALSIMVFFALCCQCAATLATIKRETKSWAWPVLTFTYMTALAYVGALATYQIAIRWV
jgi:ferrous iron transport protein B